MTDESVVFAEMNEQAVLLHVDTGVYYGLDEVGARIWAALVERRDIQTTYQLLLDEYDVDAEQLRNDMTTFLERLLGLQLLQLVEPPGDAPASS